MNAELLRKTAALIRSQEEEKAGLANKLDTITKEATVSRTVLNMLKEGLLDVDEIDAKASEFNSNGDLLGKTAEYFEKKATGSGKIKDPEIEGGSSAEDSFLAALQG